MNGIFRPLGALLLGITILLLGNGLHGLVVPLRAQAEAFTQLQIGQLGSFYYLGLLLGCLTLPRLISRVGHVRAFSSFTALVTVIPLLHVLWIEPLFWSALRFLTGIGFAGLFMGIESWLSQSSKNSERGRVLAAYTIVNLTAVPLGMQLIHAAAIESFEPFVFIAVFYSLAAMPVSLSRTSAPEAPPSARLRLKPLIKASPSAVIGCFAAGLANSAIWTMITVYGHATGLSASEAGLLLSVIVLSGAAGQWTIGTWSDRIGRLEILFLAATIATAAGGYLFATEDLSFTAVLVAGGFFGLGAFSIYPLSVARANDMVPRSQAIETAGGLLVIFSLAAILGPSVAALAMKSVGGSALFLLTTIAHGSLTLALALRFGFRRKSKHHEAFVAVPRTTQAVFQLDPRSKD